MHTPFAVLAIAALLLAGCQDAPDPSAASTSPSAGAAAKGMDAPGVDAPAPARTEFSLHPTHLQGDLALRLAFDFPDVRQCDLAMGFSGVSADPVRVLAYTELPAQPEQGTYLEAAFSSQLSIQHGDWHASDETILPVLDSLGYRPLWSVPAEAVNISAQGSFTVTILAKGLGGNAEEPLALDLECDGPFVVRSIEAGRRVVSWREGKPDEGTGAGVNVFPMVPDVCVARDHRWTFDVGGATTMVRMFSTASPEAPGVEDWQATVTAADGSITWDETTPLGPWGKAYAHDAHGPTVDLHLDRVAVGRSLLHGIAGALDPLEDVAALETWLTS